MALSELSCSAEGCQKPGHRVMYHSKNDEKRVYCSSHVGVAVRQWDADYPNGDEFPELHDQPTSDVPRMARADEIDGYRSVECRDCGSEAFAKRRIGQEPEFWTYACRNCRKGARILTKHSNYGVAWDQVREWVKDRDGRECIACSSDSHLHVHHKKKLVYFETTKEANQPENLVTLCKECHKDRESVHEPGRLNGDDVRYLAL